MLPVISRFLVPNATVDQQAVVLCYPAIVSAFTRMFMCEAVGGREADVIAAAPHLDCDDQDW